MADKKRIPVGKAIVAYIAANEGTEGVVEDVAEILWESIIYRDRQAKAALKDIIYEGGLYIIKNPVDVAANAGVYGTVAEMARRAVRAFGLKSIDFGAFVAVV